MEEEIIELCECGHKRTEHFNNQECIAGFSNGMQCPCKKFKLKETKK